MMLSEFLFRPRTDSSPCGGSGHRSIVFLLSCLFLSPMVNDVNRELQVGRHHVLHYTACEP